jgi:hypothetical protein
MAPAKLTGLTTEQPCPSSDTVSGRLGDCSFLYGRVEYLKPRRVLAGLLSFTTPAQNSLEIRTGVSLLISPGESIRESGSAGKEAPLITAAAFVKRDPLRKYSQCRKLVQHVSLAQQL